MKNRTGVISIMLFLPGLALISACQPEIITKPETLKIYQLTLIRPIQDVYTSLPPETERKDTIMALNDTIAYQRALIIFYGTTYGNQPYSKEFLSHLRSPKRFSIKAPNGQIIENKLSDTIKRRLDRYIKGIAEKALADCRYL